MKNYMATIIGIGLSFFSVLPVNADSNFSINIENKNYQGTYLPIDYINKLEETKSHEKALLENQANKYRDVLSVNENIVYSDLKFHDQYAIPSEDAKRFEFSIVNGNVSVVDEDGNKYLKIADNSNSYNKAVSQYLLRIVLNPLLSNSKIENLRISEDSLFINENKYEIILDTMFFPKDCDVILYDRSLKIAYNLIVKKDEIIVIELQRSKEIGYESSGNIKYRFVIRK